MTEREKFLLRMAVLYLIANRSDACEAFGAEEDTNLSVNGEWGSPPTEDELDQLMRTLQ